MISYAAIEASSAARLHDQLSGALTVLSVGVLSGGAAVAGTAREKRRGNWPGMLMARFRGTDYHC